MPHLLPTPTDQIHLDQVRASVDAAFEQAIGPARRVALLGYPFDGNVGNHMMWLAITDFLAERGIEVVFAAHFNGLDLDGLAEAIGPDPILFCGGVTMSRLWPDHPQARREVAARFPENRVVSLTSTMLFADEDDARSAADIFGDHAQVVLMARDPRSAEQAEQVYGDSVELITVHDSALRLPPMPTTLSAAPVGSILWLQRDDPESAGQRVQDDVSTFDWAAISKPIYRWAYLRLRLAGALKRLPTPAARFAEPQVAEIYRRVSRSMVGIGADLIAGSRVLVTDRMHPHILSTLIGQHVVTMPDRFGKNWAVHQYSTSPFSTVHWADGPAEALALARDLAKLPSAPPRGPDGSA